MRRTQGRPVANLPAPDLGGYVRLQRLDDGQILFETPLQPAGSVPGWQGRAYWRADFSAFKEPGHYRLEAITAQGIVRSTRFAIGQDLLASRCLSDVIHYFKGQRASGTFDRADRNARLFGTDQHKDVHGGWFDASGDMSKYLSHLSYANYLNPSRPPWWCGPCSSAGNCWPRAAISTGEPLQTAQ